MVIVAGYAALLAAIHGQALSLPLGMIASSILLYLSFTVAHEAGHGNIAHEVGWMRPVERALGWAATLPFLIVPFGLFARIHDYHHAFTNDPDRDPDYIVSGKTGWSVVPHALTIPLEYLRLTFTRFADEPVFARTHKTSLAYYMVTVSVIVALVWSGYGRELLWLGVLPLFIASFILAMLFDWIPHTPASRQGRWENTRSYLFPGLKYLTLGQNYHHIHHLYPRVPWYHYDRVFEAIRPELEAQGAPIEDLAQDGPAVLLKSPAAREPRTDGRSDTMTLAVASINRTTADSAEITFANPDGKSIAFKAGQYVTLSKRVKNETVTRCYSICEAPASGRLSVGVKRVEGGLLSTYLNSELQVGGRLTVAGPFGDFIYEPPLKAGARETLYLIAGGSGITPVLSILQMALAGHERTRVHLIYANRSSRDEMFRERLDELATRYDGRLTVTRVYEQAHENWKGAMGRLDKRKLKAMLKNRPRGARFYICGPTPMKNLVTATLRELKIAPARIAVEEFAQAAPEAKGRRHSVEIELAGGARHELEVAENQTVLQAANNRGIRIPHACGVGQCGCCMMRVMGGSWESASEVTPGLTPGEKEQGLTLACSCRPKSALSLREGKS